METLWDAPTFGLLALVAIVAGAILAGVRRADKLALAKGTGTGTGTGTGAGTQPFFPLAAAALALWLAYAAQLALRGRLLPPEGGGVPHITLLMPPGLVLAVWAAYSPLGIRLTALPYAALIGFQAFRVPLEILLWAFHKQGRLPVQMTFSGRNFDVLTGLSALLVAWLAARGKLGRKGILAWNLAGLALLANIIAVAILSLPAPWRAFANDPPNELVLHFPYVYIPALFVMAALAGHLLVFRKLAREGRAGAAR
jgi:hypothetical protein